MKRMAEKEARDRLQAAGYRCRWQGIYLLALIGDSCTKIRCAGGTVSRAAVEALLGPERCR